LFNSVIQVSGKFPIQARLIRDFSVPSIIMPPASQLLQGFPAPATQREALLQAVLNQDQLPSPPVIALQIVNVASQPDCEPAEVVALLHQDPALCAQLLKAVNSCLYALC
jgi:hypothetical protein